MEPTEPATVTSTAETVEALQRIPVLAWLPVDELRRLAGRMKPRRATQDEVVVRQGDAGDSLFLVLSGQLRVVSDVPAERVLLARLGPGEFFGEGALLFGQPRSAAVVADADTDLLELDRADFDALLASTPGLRTELERVAATRRDRSGPRFHNEAYTLAALSPAIKALRIGSDPACDIVIDAPGVSPAHVEIVRDGDGFAVQDLSGGWTYLNREPVTRARLQEGDTLRLGSRRLFLHDGVLKLFERARGVRVEAHGLGRTVPRGRWILRAVDLVVRPGELVAIVGSSGAGKTTLLHLLVGLDTPAAGEVLLDGRPLGDHLDALRSALGYVPQHDIVHAALTARESLRFAARMRLPKNIRDEEIDRRIDDLARRLGLEDHLDTRVGALSGGQRKRASTAAELLSDPRLLFLDEPTSGLDPDRDEQLMREFRALADDGRTVLITTHATRNIRFCDRVIVLHQGRLAFTGAPAEALAFFGVGDFAEIYGKLAETEGVEAEERFRRSATAARELPGAPDMMAESAAPTAREIGQASTRRGGLAMVGLLMKRDLKLLLADRPSMALRLAGAPLLALTELATFDPDVFELLRFDGGSSSQAMTLIYLSSAICLFLSAFTSANVIVSEGGIYRRERLLGLSPLAYVSSKVLVLGAFAILQGFVFVGILATRIDFTPGPPIYAGTAAAIEAAERIAAQGPYEGLIVVITLGGAMALVSLCGVAMGLLVSALSPNVDRAAILVVLVLIPQLIFAGSSVPRSEMSYASRRISDLTVTKWSVELGGIVTDLDTRVKVQRQWSVDIFGGGMPMDFSFPYQPFENSFKGDTWPRWTFLSGFAVAGVLATLLVQSRKGRPRRAKGPRPGVPGRLGDAPAVPAGR